MDLSEEGLQYRPPTGWFKWSEHPRVNKPLRTLDVFAGCGGLSSGLESSGVAKVCWRNFLLLTKAFTRDKVLGAILWKNFSLKKRQHQLWNLGLCHFKTIFYRIASWSQYCRSLNLRDNYFKGELVHRDRPGSRVSLQTKSCWCYGH